MEKITETPQKIAEDSETHISIYAWNLAVSVIKSATYHITKPGDLFQKEFYAHPEIAVRAKELLQEAGWEVVIKTVPFAKDHFPTDPIEVLQRTNEESMEDFCKRSNERDKDSHYWQLWVRYPK